MDSKLEQATYACEAFNANFQRANVSELAGRDELIAELFVERET